MADKGLAVQRAEERPLAKKTDFESLYEQMDGLFDRIANRAFQLFDTNGRTFGHELADWLQAESEVLHPVHIDVTESNEAVTVQAEVPGFSEKELEIKVEGRQLTIAGKRETTKESKQGKTVYSERCANQVYRSITLPATVDAEKAKATLKNGVLEIELAKAAPAKTVKVEPKAT